MSKRRDIRNFYLAEGDRQVYDLFKKICKREGASISKRIMELIREYIRVHEPGNPQRSLEPILKKGSYEEAKPVCSYCRQPARYVIYVADYWDGPFKSSYACETHRNFFKVAAKMFGERKL